MTGKEDTLFQFGAYFEEKQRFGFVDLVQVSEVVLYASAEIPVHTQTCHEISYVVSGTGSFYTGDTAYTLKKGDVQVVTAGEDHRIVASPTENLRYICIGFTFGEVPDAYREICRFYEESVQGVANCNHDVRELFDMLMGEFYLVREDSHITIGELLRLILTKVRRLFFEPSEKNNKECECFEPGLIYRVLKYIDDHIFTIRMVGEIADALHYSENYLSTSFSKKMGKTLQGYMSERKLDTARMLLENGNLSEREVAELLHFDCLARFSRNFKKAYGVTPRQYLCDRRKETNYGK